MKDTCVTTKIELQMNKFDIPTEWPWQSTCSIIESTK